MSSPGIDHELEAPQGQIIKLLALILNVKFLALRARALAPYLRIKGNTQRLLRELSQPTLAC